MSPRFQFLAILILIAIISWCYLPGLNSYFIGETWIHLAHVEVHNDDPVQICFSTVTSFGETIGNRPVKLFTHYLFYNAFGLDPLPFHLMSLLLHMSCAVLVFYIISTFTKDGIIGLLVTVLFSVHWLNSEVVAWLPGNPEGLRTFFILITVVAFYKYRAGCGRIYYILSLFALILSVGSQENSIMLPFVLLCTDIYYKNISLDTSGLLRRPIDTIKELKINQLYPHIPLISLSVGYALWLRFYSEAIANISYKFTFLNSLEGVRQHMIYLFTLPFVIDSTFLFITSVVVIILLGYLYFACCPKEQRARINLLFLSLLILIAPFALIRGGFAARYAYLPIIITLTISTLLVKEGAWQLFSALGLQDKSLKNAVYGTCITFCLILLPFHYSFLNKNLDYYRGLGEISRSFVNTMKKDFPEGLKGQKVAFVNFPRVIEAEFGPKFGLTNALLFEYIKTPLSVIFKGEDLSHISVISIPLPPQAGFHPLIWTSHQVPVIKMDASQYNELAQKSNTKIYFFNPSRREILNVSGQPYKKLQTLVQ